jgi:hypothetical protein
MTAMAVRRQTLYLPRVRDKVKEDFLLADRGDFDGVPVKADFPANRQAWEL